MPSRARKLDAPEHLLFFGSEKAHPESRLLTSIKAFISNYMDE